MSSLEEELQEAKTLAVAWQKKYSDLRDKVDEEIQYRVMRARALEVEKFRVGKFSDKDQSLINWGIAFGQSKMLWDLAVWKDGTPLVGIQEKPFSEAVVGYRDAMKLEQDYLGLSACQLGGCKGCPECKPSPVLMDGLEDLNE